MPELAPAPPSRRDPAAGALCFFAATLAMGALFFYLGDIGKWREDFAWTLRDPVTGLGDWASLLRFPFFWRPCSLVYVRAINTLFWDHDQVRQALAVLAHLAAAAALWRLLRALAVGPRMAGAGALVFMVLPHAYEVAFWPSATPTAIATALLLLVLGEVIRFARGARPGLARIVILTALIPCWNEQPACAIAALPLLYLAACPAQQPWRARLARAAAATGACIGVNAAYLTLYLVTGAPGARGAIGSYAAPALLPERALETGRRVADYAAGPAARQMLAGSARLGAEVLYTPAGAIWLCVAALAGALWVRRLATPATQCSPPHDPPRAALLILFSLAAGAAMFLPMILISGIGIEPRFLYPPAACLIIAIATAAAAPLARGLARPGARLIVVATACAFTAGLLFLAVCLIGYQTLLQRRSRMDWAQAAALRAALPNPAPGSIFIAARVDATAAGTGHAAFDLAEFGASSRDAYGSSLLRHAYARADLFSKRLLPAEIAFDESGADTRVWLRPGFTRGIFELRHFTWDQIILFDIEHDGRIRLASTVRLQRPDIPELLITLPPRSLADDPGLTITIPAPTASPHPSASSPPGSSLPPGSPPAAPR